MTASCSVVIPTHQRRERCLRAVRSALEQTVPPLEVLVCDDASTDGTAEAIEEWAREEPRLRCLRRDRNSGGPAGPRNLGVASARGEWVAFLDDDDEWLPDKLERQVPLLDDGGFDVVAGAARRRDGPPYHEVPPVPDPTWRDLLRDNPVVLSTAVARRRAVQAVGGFREDPALRGVEDYCLWLDLVRAGARLRVAPDVVALYEAQAPDRLSAGRASERAVAAHLLRLWREDPRQPRLAAAAAWHGWRVVKLALRGRGESARRSADAPLQPPAPPPHERAAQPGGASQRE